MRRITHRLGVIAAALALTTATASVATADEVPPSTPGPERIFNGFTLAALNSATQPSAQESFEALLADDPFYAEPPLTGSEKPGDILKSKKVKVIFSGVSPGNVEGYKLMYVTTGNDGKPFVSTGVLLMPVDGQPNSRRHVIGYQEANDSVGWNCHPSTQWTGGAPLDGAAWSALGPLAMMFDKGYAVMISDVGNDADKKPHGVFAGKFGAHALLDGVRAALRLGDAGLNPEAQVALFGIAGGGVGAGFATELAAEYAPELDIKSTVLEGMVVKPREFMRVADGSIGSGFALATLLGLEPWYPEMEVNAKLTPAGRGLADFFRTQCQVPAYFGTPFLPLRSLFASGVSPADEPAFQHAFDDNVLGRSGTPKGKVIIASCAKDDSFMSLVPARDARELADTYRAQGADVSYQPTDCGMERFISDLYGWGTDLFGMQTIDQLDSYFS
ncbi:lipase family protein [Nocardia goodfellowii]|uniref:Lipase n=1 Tax=Nocardia goodfellowii TaxID=882446 RepID=A0ABS4QLM0_9NOCA|nr:lipase family protein [Nocardia goodfellowii]MBP2192604.1 hypothetical protein [Nocardia goodfellowii]